MKKYVEKCKNIIDNNTNKKTKYMVKWMYI